MTTIAMQPDPDVWDREEVIRALNNGHAIFQANGPLMVKACYPSAIDPNVEVAILEPESKQDQLRVSFPRDKRDRYFPSDARFRMILISEEPHENDAD